MYNMILWTYLYKLHKIKLNIVTTYIHIATNNIMRIYTYNYNNKIMKLSRSLKCH